MKALIKHQKNIILVSSILGILGFVGYLFFYLKLISGRNLSSTEMMNELSTQSFTVLFLIPALLGLFYYLKRPNTVNSWVIVSYFVYLLLLIFFAILLLIPTSDPLQIGLPMILIAIPLCLVVVIILIVNLFKTKHIK